MVGRLRTPAPSLVRAAAVALAGAIWLAAPAVRAQAPSAWVPPPEVVTHGAVEEPAPAPRPRLSMAIGMGTTFDSVGFAATRALPAYFATGGAGDGLLGLDFQAFASSAIGRVAMTNPVDRLSLTAIGVIRPAAQVRPDDQRYRMRVLRTLAAELGLGFERDGRTVDSGSRFVAHLGARVELPLTPPGERSELRIRLGVSRGIGLYTPTLQTATDTTVVVDTKAELYGAIVVVF